MTITSTAPLKKDPGETLRELPVPLWARLARNLIWAPLIVVGVLACSESLLRLGHVGEEQVWHPDSTFGLIGQPGQEFTFKSEGYSAGKFNSAGFNDREFAVAKKPGVMRIALLGDSKTEAMQVPREYNYGRLLEAKLNASGKKAEVLNFGVSAFNTGQEYLLYLEKVAQYKPDVLVLMYNAGDTEETIKPAGPLSGIFPRPYFLLNPDSSLSIDWSVVDDHLNNPKAQLIHRFQNIRDNSRLWGLFEKIEPTLNTVPVFKWLGERVSGVYTSASTPSNDVFARRMDYLNHFEKSPYGAPLPDSVKSFHADIQPKNEIQIPIVVNNTIFKTTATIIYRLNELCKQNNCKLIVVGVPSLNNSIYYVRQLNDMEKLAKERSFDFINLQQVFPSLAPMEKSPYLYPSFHFNAKGHELVAHTLYEKMDKTSARKP